MGMTFQTFDLLKKNINEFGQLGNVLTLGRLGNQIDKKKLKLLGLENDKAFSHEYSEEILIKHLGASSVDSIDNSDFEKANIVHDMNEELKIIKKRYDTIIDFGTSEHIFNINQNLRNISNLCKNGGRIVHCLPANNQCGHGFWQFSPELFFSLYDELNGYQSTKLYLIDSYDARNYWQIKKELNSPEVMSVRQEFFDFMEDFVQAGRIFDFSKKWNRGDCIIFNDHLALHGRDAFLGNNRWLRDSALKNKDNKQTDSREL